MIYVAYDSFSPDLYVIFFLHFFPSQGDSKNTAIDNILKAFLRQNHVERRDNCDMFFMVTEISVMFKFKKVFVWLKGTGVQGWQWNSRYKIL